MARRLLLRKDVKRGTKGYEADERLQSMRPTVFSGGMRVAFRLCEAICPTTAEVAEQITPDLEIRGQVVFLSDSGDSKDHYAIVEVVGLATPVIVPVSRIRHAAREAESAVA